MPSEPEKRKRRFPWAVFLMLAPATILIFLPRTWWVERIGMLVDWIQKGHW